MSGPKDIPNKEYPHTAAHFSKSLKMEKSEPLKKENTLNQTNRFETNPADFPDEHSFWKQLALLGGDFACIVDPDGIVQFPIYPDKNNQPGSLQKGDNLFDWTLISFHQQIQSSFQAAVNHDLISSLEFVLFVANGDFLWLKCKCRKIVANSRRLILICGNNITEYKKSFLSLQQSKNRYQMLCEHCSDMISHHDPDGRFLYVSGICSELLGYDPDELVGRNAFDLIHPEDKDNLYQLKDSLVHSQGIRKIMYRIQHKKGHYLWAESLAQTMVEHENYKSLELLVVTRNVSHWVQNQKLLCIQKDLASRLAVTDKLESAFEHVLDSLLEIDGIHIVGTFWYDSGKEVFQLYSTRNVTEAFRESLHNEFALSRYSKIIRGGSPVYYSIRRAVELFPEVKFPSGVKSIGIVPVAYEGQIVASINICSDSFHMIPAYVCTALETIAAMLAPVLARLDAEEKVQQNEQRLRLICESTDDMISLQDLSGKYIYFNGPVKYKKQWPNIIGKTVFDIMPQPTAKALQQQFEKVLRTGSSLTCEYDVNLREKKYWYSSNIYPIRNDQGQITSVARISRNITERKEYEQRLQYEHNLLENITKSQLDHIYVKDPKGVIIFSNKDRYQNDPRHPNESYLGLTDYDFMPHFEAEHFRQQELRILSTGMPLLDQEQILDDYSGSKKTLLVTKLPLRNKEDEIIGIIGVNRDITELKRAQEQIDRIFKLSRDILCILSLEGNFIHVSPAIHRVLGYREGEVIGKNICDFVCPESKKDLQEKLREHFLTGEVLLNQENQYLCSDGARKWLSWVAYPKIEEKRAYAVARDITGQKENTELLRKQEQLLYHVERVASVGEMASALAHELNQPLCAITTYADACRRLLDNKKPVREAIEESLNKIAVQSSRAGKVVNSIKNLVRKEPPQKTRLHLKEVLTSVLELLEFELKSAAIRISVRIEPENATVQADCVQLQQVFLNLIRNSIEAMKNNTEEKTLDIHAFPIEEKRMQVDVTDNGMGMSREKAEVVFDSFFTTKNQGLGIGLTICKSIIESHGGSIQARPNTAKGMTISFTLITQKGGITNDREGNDLCSG